MVFPATQEHKAWSGRQFKKLIILCVSGFGGGQTHATACIWRSGDTLWEFHHSFHSMGSVFWWSQVIRLGSKHPCLLSWPAGPWKSFLTIYSEFIQLRFWPPTHTSFSHSELSSLLLLFLIQGFTFLPRLAWNFRPASNSWWSSCLSLLNSGLTSQHLWRHFYPYSPAW